MSSSLLREAKKSGASAVLEDREQVRGWDLGAGTQARERAHASMTTFICREEVRSRHHHVTQ